MKIPIREGEFKGFLLLWVRGHSVNQTIRYFFKLQAIFQDVNIKVYAEKQNLQCNFFLSKSEINATEVTTYIGVRKQPKSFCEIAP